MKRSKADRKERRASTRTGSTTAAEAVALVLQHVAHQLRRDVEVAFRGVDALARPTRRVRGTAAAERHRQDGSRTGRDR